MRVIRQYRSLLAAAWLLALAAGMGACEKMILDEAEQTGSTGQSGNVTIKASVYSIVPFSRETRTVQSIAECCTKLCFVVYQDGAQKKKVLQKKGDDSFGQTSFSLPSGDYQLLVLGHSSTANPTLANPESIQFKNADGFSDTFYYYDDLTVTAQAERHNVMMERATSMLRIIINDEELPEELDRIRVYYTGESGVFNAVAGWGGAVNSKQNSVFDVKGQGTPLTLEAYTFLRDDVGSLNVTLTAYDDSGNVLAERELTDVPMRNRMVTEYSGPLFGPSSVMGEQTFLLQAETDWELYRRGSF